MLNKIQMLFLLHITYASTPIKQITVFKTWSHLTDIYKSKYPFGSLWIFAREVCSI